MAGPPGEFDPGIAGLSVGEPLPDAPPTDGVCVRGAGDVDNHQIQLGRGDLFRLGRSFAAVMSGP